MKARHKMSPEELKEFEYWQALRAQKIPELKFALMLGHAKGQCEEEIDSGRCPERHGEPGTRINGTIILTPRLGAKPILQCQKCGFDAIRKRLLDPIKGRRVSKRKAIDQKNNPAQELLV